jgi:hypothetical protein
MPPPRLIRCGVPRLPRPGLRDHRATIEDMKPEVFRRFMRWRMKPHSYEIEWIGVVTLTRPRASAERPSSATWTMCGPRSITRSEGRCPTRQRCRQCPGARSPPRDVRLTMEQLGAIVGYAAYDIEALRWILGMIATAAGLMPFSSGTWRRSGRGAGRCSTRTRWAHRRRRSGTPWFPSLTSSGLGLRRGQTPPTPGQEPEDLVAHDAGRARPSRRHCAEGDPPHDRHELRRGACR